MTRAWLVALVALVAVVAVGGCTAVFGIDSVTLDPDIVITDGGDDGAPPPGIRGCTLVPQSGCVAASPACDVDRDDHSTVCRAAVAGSTSDSACSAAAACGVGFTCVDLGVDKDQCRKFCNTDFECSGTGTRCIRDLLDASAIPIPGVKLCSNSCSPTPQSGCPASTNCIPVKVTDGKPNYTDCFSAGTKSVGASCLNSHECAIGLACFGFSVPGVCKKLCDAGIASTCPNGQTCSGGVDVGGRNYGQCDPSTFAPSPLL
jgi:hypothetical protein